MGWFAYLPLLWAQRDVSTKRAFLLGWVTGTVANVGNFYWVYELMVTHSAMPAMAAVVATFIGCMQQGLREAIWLGLCKRYEGGSWPLILTVPTVYAATEFLYPTIFPLFLSNSQSNCLWTHQAMDIAGPVGLSWLMVAFVTGLFLLLKNGKLQGQPVAAFGILALTLLYGYVRVGQVEAQMATAEKIRVGMVENDVGLGSLDMGRAKRQIDMARELARVEKPELIVFPETAVRTPAPPYKSKGQPDFARGTTRFYPLNMTEVHNGDQFSVQLGYKVPVLFGCTAIDLARPGPVPGRPALFNAAFLLDGQGKVLGTALKNKLLVFGEYVPGSHLYPWIYSDILTKSSALYAGTEPAVIDFQKHRLGVTICYEDILPDFSYDLLQKEPELLVNLTNDGWFGKTAEPATHLALSQARAVESRLYMVRSTCTGISAFVDPLGRVMKKTSIYEPETLVADVAWMPGGGLFRHLGPLVSWGFVFLSLLWLGWRRQQLKAS